MDSGANVQQCPKVVDGQRCYKPLHHYGQCDHLDLTVWWEQDGAREEANRRLSQERFGEDQTGGESDE